MMTLLCLFVGLIVYTYAVIACANVERDYRWRQWIENFRPMFGPDGRDRTGKSRRDYLRQGKSRIEASEREDW